MTAENIVMLKDGAFREASSGRGILLGNQCSKCGLISFPKAAVCPECFEKLPEEAVELGEKGRIESFTISHVAPEGFKAPYVQAYVRIEEGPKIFSLLNVDIDKLSSIVKGSKVRLRIKVIGTDSEGRSILGWTYQPIEDDNYE